MRSFYRYRTGSIYRSALDGRAGKKVFGIFLIIGLAFLLIAGGFALYQSTKAKEYIPTEAVIIELDRKGTPTVEYKANGRTLTKNLNTSSNLYSIGDIIPISYDANTPTRIIQRGVMGWLFTIISGSIGLSFALIGGISLLRIRRREELEQGDREQEDRPVPWEN